MTRIRQLREEQGMRQYELAAKMGVKQASVHKWETGKGFPSTANLMALANLFGVSMDYILGRNVPKDGQNSA